MSGKPKVQKFLERVFGFNADSDGVQRYSELTEKGQEIPDPVPMHVIVPGGTNLTLGEQIEQAIHSAEWRRAAMEEGIDTPEEADDLDIEDDPLDPLTPYESFFVGRDVKGKPFPKPPVDPPKDLPPEIAQPSVKRSEVAAEPDKK